MTEPEATETPEGEERREFLAKCGRFAAITPPAITMLLSTSLTSNAIASSAGGRSLGRGGGFAVHRGNNGNNGNRNAAGNGNGYGRTNGNGNGRR